MELQKCPSDVPSKTYSLQDVESRAYQEDKSERISLDHQFVATNELRVSYIYFHNPNPLIITLSQMRTYSDYITANIELVFDEFGNTIMKQRIFNHSSVLSLPPMYSALCSVYFEAPAFESWDSLEMKNMGFYYFLGSIDLLTSKGETIKIPIETAIV